MPRVIGHLDLDYFYAQVEEVENPSLKGKPVMVCVFSGRTDDSGVVSTANYEARALGVHSGMPIVQAKKKLEGQEAAVIRMDHPKYEAVSERVMGALEQMVDVLEPTGIDEAFFDLTASTGGDYERAKTSAEKIKASIRRSEGLTSSVGLGRSKVVAKLGSDFAKPDGLTVVVPEATARFLEGLPATKLYGVGPKTAESLEGMGIRTAGDLSRAPPAELGARFGRRLAAYLLAASTGTDSDQIHEGQEPTQFSRIVTLKRDTRDPAEAMQQLSQGLEYIQGKLKSKSKSFRTVTAIGIFTDLSARTKSRTFEAPVDDRSVLREAASALFEELTGTATRDLRRAGVRVSGLVDVESQSSLSDFLRQAG